MAAKSSKKPTFTLVPTVKVVSILHQQFKTLSCYSQVVAHLKQGFSLEYVRTMIQEKQQEWQDIPSNVVLERLGKLHHELTALDTVAPFLPGYVEEAAKVVEDGLNEVVEIAELYQLQRERIKIAMDLEKNMNLLSPNTVREVRLAKDLVEASASIKASIGLYKNQGTKESQAPQIPTTPGKFESVTPKNASKILGIVKMLQAKASGNTEEGK